MTCLYSCRTVLMVLAASLSGLNGAAHAQAYPSKPVRLIVPYAPGGGVDLGVHRGVLAPRPVSHEYASPAEPALTTRLCVAAARATGRLAVRQRPRASHPGCLQCFQ